MIRPITLATITIACVAFASVGCYAEATTEPAYAQTNMQGDYVEGDVPGDIETYPTVVYENRPVYLYRDRWYVRHGHRWVYYRTEPRVLHEHRVRIHRERHEHDHR